MSLKEDMLRKSRSAPAPTGDPVVDGAVACGQVGVYVFPARWTYDSASGKKVDEHFHRWWNKDTPRTAAHLGGVVIRKAFSGGRWNAYGIDMGASGLAGIDLDGPEAADKFAALCAEHGDDPQADGAHIKHTPRDGGMHVVFRNDPQHPIGNGAGVIAPQIDHRGVGGLLYGTGSYDERGPYTGPEMPRPSTLPVIYPWLRDLANGGRKAVAEAETEAPDGEEDEFDVPGRGEKAYNPEHVDQVIRTELAKLEKAPKDKINTTLNNVALYLFHFVPEFIGDKELAGRLVQAQRKAWVSSGGPDNKDYRAAKKTIISARTKAKSEWTAVRCDGTDGPCRPSPASGRFREDRTTVRTGQPGRDGRTRVNVSNTAEAADWLRERIGTEATRGLFVRDGMLVHCPRIGEHGYRPLTRVEGDFDGTAQVRPMEKDGLSALIENVYDVGVPKERKTAEDVSDEPGEDVQDDASGPEENEPKITVSWQRRLLPSGITKHVYSSVGTGHTPTLPVLQGVTHTPIMRRDGSVFAEPGYDEAERDVNTGMLFLPERGLVVPEVADHPSPAQIRAAVNLLNLPIKDFPFVTDGDKGNWLGTMLAPLLRPLLPADTRRFLVMVDAPSPGSGKSLLATMIKIVHDGVLRAEVPTEDKAEMSKMLASVLVSTTAPVVIFDNVTGVIRSSVLEGMITSGELSERILGITQMAKLVNDRQWIMTGNNAKIGGDLGRRTVWITIDPRTPEPHNRRFEINPERWMTEHRGEYVTALLTLVRAWHVAGRPVPDPGRSDGFAPLVAAVRGIFEVAGISLPYGEPRDGDRGALSDDDAEWGEFLAVLIDGFGLGTRFVAADIAKKIEYGSLSVDCLPGDLAHKVRTPGFTKSLGRWFQIRLGRWCGGVSVAGVKKPTAPNRGAMQFWIIDDPNAAEPTGDGGSVTRLPHPGAAGLAEPDCEDDEEWFDLPSS